MNRGDEFLPFYERDAWRKLNLNLVGMDHSSSAIEKARARFPQGVHRSEYRCEDLCEMDLKKDEQYGLLISINTLHGSYFDGKAIFRKVFQEHLKNKSGSVILGFPNCRYMDGEVIYGGK